MEIRNNILLLVDAANTLFRVDLARKSVLTRDQLCGACFMGDKILATSSEDAMLVTLN